MRTRNTGAALLVAVALAACSSGPADAPSATPSGTLLTSVPTSAADNCTGPAENQVRTCAAWGEPGQIVVVVVGSSSCPVFAASAVMTAPQQVVINLGSRGGPSCTADAVETASVIAAPAGLDETKRTVLTIGKLTIELPPRVQP